MSKSLSSFRFVNKVLRRASHSANRSVLRSTACRALFSSLAKETFPVSAFFVEGGGDRVVLCCDYHDELELASPWLWSNDSKWVHPTSGQRLKTPAEYPGTKITNARLVPPAAIGDLHDKLLVPPPEGSCHPTGIVYSSNRLPKEIEDWVLEVQWEDSDESSYYFLSWLLEQATPRQETRSSRVTQEHALNRDRQLVEVDYQSLIQDCTIRYDLYSSLFQDGAVLVRNCPNIYDCDESTPSAVVGKLLAGSLSHGALYGDVFHVQAMPLAHNVAYTTMGLSPHQDLAYYESPPGLQLLHCVARQGIVGGESTLVDGMAAAHYLRELAPDLFEILCTTDATFCKQREGADMVAYFPHIQSKENGEVVAVNWSPPFEGPLRDMNKARDYYTAYAAFARLVDKDLPPNHHSLSPNLCRSLKEYAEHHTFQRLLEEGEMLVFNNRRLLHGRAGFGPTGITPAARHLVGTYTNMEEALNQYRLLMRKYGWRYDMLNAGNGTVS